MPLWGNRKRIPWKNNNTPRSCPQYQKNSNYYRNNNPRLSEKLLGFYELLKAEKQIKITGELLDNYKPINAALAEACGLALRQPITGRQYVLMTNASFRVSGYALMIEENNEKKRYYKKMTFATLTFGSKVFSAQLKMPTFCKKIPSNQSRIYKVQSHLMGNNITNTRKDRQPVCHTFLPNQRQSPHTMERVRLCRKIQLPHNALAGTQNTAADFLSRKELNPKKKD